MMCCTYASSSSSPQGSVDPPRVGHRPAVGERIPQDVDCMLEKAQQTTQDGPFETVRYVRFADDVVVLCSAWPTKRHWAVKVERRLREELEKLDLKVNEEKSKVVEFAKGETFDFLGYTFYGVPSKKDPGKKIALSRPMKKRRTQFLRTLKATIRLHLS